MSDHYCKLQIGIIHEYRVNFPVYITHFPFCERMCAKRQVIDYDCYFSFNFCVHNSFFLSNYEQHKFQNLMELILTIHIGLYRVRHMTVVDRCHSCGESASTVPFSQYTRDFELSST